MATEKTIIIPENATNGDLIRAIFPTADIKKRNNDKYRSVYVIKVDNETVFSSDWWEAPYKQ